jgi:hypothetical protein
MKKRLIFICILSALLVTANSQTFGIKAGVSLSKAQWEYAGEKVSTSNLIGFQAGIIGEFPISDALFVNSGLLFSQKGTTVTLLDIDIKMPINYLEIPINLSYKFDAGGVSLFVQAGPYFGVGLSGKMKSGDAKEKIEFGSGDAQLKRMDIGVNVGAGVEIDIIQLGINYGLGITGLSNDPEETLKNRTLSFSVAVLFGK